MPVPSAVLKPKRRSSPAATPTIFATGSLTPSKSPRSRAPSLLQLGLNVDLVEALALVHDIGHPPFGHAGEKALDAAMREHGLSFDHNLHALRIVEDFEIRYAAFRGLNLTFEVREGIIKHSRDYDPQRIIRN